MFEEGSAALRCAPRRLTAWFKRTKSVTNSPRVALQCDLNKTVPRRLTEIVRVQYFVRGGFVGYRSRASSKHLSPHLPVGSLDSSGGSNRGCAASEAARVGVESTKKPTPDVVVVFET
ncbi:hypothetical protein TNCV_1086571 [Trichonephila clavipes]|nr:hypothetical protein TNCV_1086571 [Trichonephila clavipes]